MVEVPKATAPKATAPTVADSPSPKDKEAAWYAAIAAAPPHAAMLAADAPDTRASLADVDAVDLSGYGAGGFRLTARIKTTCSRGLIIAKVVRGDDSEPRVDVPTWETGEDGELGMKMLAVENGVAVWDTTGGKRNYGLLVGHTRVDDGKVHTLGVRFINSQYHLYVDGRREAAGFSAIADASPAHEFDVYRKAALVLGDDSTAAPLIIKLKGREQRGAYDKEVLEDQMRGDVWSKHFVGTISHVHYVCGEEHDTFPPVPEEPSAKASGAGAPAWPSADDAFDAIDANADGKLSLDELKVCLKGRFGKTDAEVEQLFGALDKAGDADSTLSRDEWHAGFYKSLPVLVGMVTPVTPDWRELHYNLPGCTIGASAEDCAITLAQLVDLKAALVRRCPAERWTNVSGAPIEPAGANLYDVCRYVIRPATEARRCAYVELVARGPQQPNFFVSHWWGEPVVDFVTCLCAHSSSRRLQVGTAGRAKALYWVCAYANNQWDLSPALTNDPKATSFYRALQEARGTVTVLDQRAITFNRIWCSFEIYTSLLETTERKKGFEYDVVTVLEPAQGHTGPPTVAGLQEGLEAAFPLALAERALETISLEHANASVPSDKVKILNRIAAGPGETLSDEQLLAAPAGSHANYDGVNHTLKAKFAQGALKRCLSENNLELLGRLCEAISYATAMREVRWCWGNDRELTPAQVGLLARSLPRKGMQIFELSLRTGELFEAFGDGVQPNVLSDCTSINIAPGAGVQRASGRCERGGALALAKALARQTGGCPKLDQLRLTSTCHAGRHDATLESGLCANGLEDGAVVLARALGEGLFPNLTHLELAADGIGEAGAAALGEAVAKGGLDNVKGFHLQENPIPEAGWVAFFAGCTQRQSERFRPIELNLSGAHHVHENNARVKVCIGAAGGRALAAFFASPNAACLASVKVANCRLGDDGLIALAEALRAPAVPELLHLDISDCGAMAREVHEREGNQYTVCGITTRGIRALIDVLASRGGSDEAADALIWAAHPFSDLGDEERRIETCGFRRPLAVWARGNPWCAWSSEEESTAMRTTCNAYAAAALALFPPKDTPPLGNKEHKHSNWRMP